MVCGCARPGPIKKWEYLMIVQKGGSANGYLGGSIRVAYLGHS